MPEFQISRESLEARDAVSDCDSIAQRIESYRHLYPTDNPKLIVASELLMRRPLSAVYQRSR